MKFDVSHQGICFGRLTEQCHTDTCVYHVTLASSSRIRIEEYCRRVMYCKLRNVVALERATGAPTCTDGSEPP